MPTRPLASGTGFELRALLSNKRSILARVGKTYNTSLQICTCCSQSSRRKAHSFLTLGRNSCGGCLARNILGSNRREPETPPRDPPSNPVFPFSLLEHEHSQQTRP